MKLQEQFIKEIQTSKQIINKILYLYADGSEDRKDLRQDILSQAWSSYPKFKRNSKFSTWLYKVAINVALSKLKKGKRQRKMLQEVKPSTSYEPINETELLQVIIQKLNEVEKSIVLLLVEGYDRPEVAEIMGISEGNLRIKIFRIRKKLKNYGIEKYVG